MPSHPDTQARRRPTHATLPEALPHDARDLGINLSQVCEQGLLAAVVRTRAERWRAANQGAIEAWNEHVEQNGIPLAEFRRF